MSLLEQTTHPADLSYRTIPLSQGQFAIVDAADYEDVAKYKWFALWSEASKTFYAVRNTLAHEGKGHTTIRMHRQIMGVPPGVDIDHKDGDGLNERRNNLRRATKSQNQHNRKARAGNKTGLKGVTFLTREGKWQAQIKLNRKNHYLGRFATPEAAHAAYVEAAKRLHGEFANW